MAPYWLDIYESTLLDGCTSKVAISNACPSENEINRSENPGCFLLHIVDVFEFLQIFISELFSFDVLPNFLPDFGLNFGMLSKEIDHHG